MTEVSLEIWIIPEHVRPVVSHNRIRKGKMERPENGLDRFTLTDVGEAAMGAYRETDLEIKVRRANPPFPWEIAFRDRGVEVAALEGHYIGPSTYRSIFRFRFIGGTKGAVLKEGLINSMDRDPLDSRYWNNDTWSRFTKQTSLTKVDVKRMNSRVLD